MSITSNEIIWRRPAEVSDLPTNGGRSTAIVIPSGVKNNLFPNVPQAERTQGSVKYRKAAIHIANSDSLALIAPKVYLLAPTPGDDRVTFFPATYTDTQSSITGMEPQFGAGTLNSNAAAQATTCTVLVENAADNIFRSGMTVRISDRATVDGVGNEQFLLLSANATYSGNVATLTFATTPLVYDFSAASPTYVSSVYTPPNTQATATDLLVTSATGGTFGGLHTITPNGIGSVEQLWTATFSSSTAFEVTGDTLGSVGSGTTTTNFIPANAAYSKPLFTMHAQAFGGVFSSGDTIQWRTHPAEIDIWYKRTVPPGANSIAANRVSLAVDGESE